MTKKRVVLRRILNPLSPITSIKETVGSGYATIKDINARMAKKRRKPRVRTFKQAMSARPRDAIPLGQITRSCLYNRRVALLAAFFSMVFSVASLVPGNYFGALTGLLFVILCLIVALKYAHRSWQIERGEAAPDEPLGSIKDFFASKGSIPYLLNPRLFD